MAEKQAINEIRRELENVDFPATKRDVMDKIGTRPLDLGGKTVEMRDILRKVEGERFETRADLVRGIQARVPEFRA